MNKSLPSNDKRRKPFTNLDGKGHRNRMRLKVLTKEASILENYELLEMLLYYVIPRRDTKPLAKRLINHFGSFVNVCEADTKALKRQLDSDKLCYLMRFVQQIALRLTAPDFNILPRLQLWKEIIVYLNEHQPDRGIIPNGSLRILFLDSRNCLIQEIYIKHERYKSIPIIFQKAVALHALRIIVVQYVSGILTKSLKLKACNFSSIVNRKAFTLNMDMTFYILYNNGQYIDLANKY